MEKEHFWLLASLCLSGVDSHDGYDVHLAAAICEETELLQVFVAAHYRFSKDRALHVLAVEIFADRSLSFYCLFLL